MRSYLKALENGDKNVYFIDGHAFFYGGDRDSCTVDGTHPNDLGFWFMANRIEKTLAEIL
jgi:lysophospholipase L1-like esterase